MTPHEKRQGVHIVSLPFTSLQYPNLGASLLTTALRGRGIKCALDYFAFDFATRIGVESYLMLSHENFYQAFLGEWIFSDLVFERPEDLDMEYLATILPDFAEPLEVLQLMSLALSARSKTRDFIDSCAASVAAQEPALVGVTTSFQQNLASVAFAKALKLRARHIPIIFGGANCEAELGQNLLKQFDAIDAVCSGEGDMSFPTFVEMYLQTGVLPTVAGILTREAGETDSQTTPGVLDLDALPIPDFSDFYASFDGTPGLSDLLTPAPTIETSRGCWWGAKHHCTFCGLNGNSMAYRSKSPERALTEFRHQADQYGADFVVVDNILDYAYFDSLLPMLRDDPHPYLMHYEVKSNLFPKHIDAMAKAGIRKIQPGIETLDTGILKLMKKGVTALQNIQTLKLCAQAGIFVDWGFIFGFPDEDPQSYQRMADLIPHLHHLQPPAAFAPVRADRFSPYFSRPADYNVDLSPAAPYRYIYAGVGEDLGQFSYHHQMSGAGIDAAHEYSRCTRTAVTNWIECHGQALYYIQDQTAQDFTLIDHRGPSKRRSHLSRLESDIIRQCSCITSYHRVVEKLAPDHETKEIEAAIDRLLEIGALVSERSTLLALPLAGGGYKCAPNWSEIRARNLQEAGQSVEA
ncbi:RiPP maturation radical SAM C-methyltransferase [uncultured Roseobacter sp.]|uniref:RiPP maturation radical SAM C-methyltransferase n=1 Tax=uncultured Roseobacter sp. TaxID=114847 RepID=UPI0026393F5C|nr:RiPP maturation radical SAM C-methyltransferase [uncultured Roseobacter sp.]